MTTMAVPYRARPKTAGIVRPKIGRTAVNAVDVIAAFANVIRPLALTGGIMALAVAWSPSVRADDQTLLSDVGIGNNGALSTAIAQIGTSICPLLVQPGSQAASTATQMSGNGGLAPPIAGFVAGAAIQSQCPAFMTALANGDLSVLGNAASMLGTAAPSIPAAGIPAAGLPALSLPALSQPAATNPLLTPGL